MTKIERWLDAAIERLDTAARWFAIAAAWTAIAAAFFYLLPLTNVGL